MNHTINSRILNLIRKEFHCYKGRNKFKFTILLKSYRGSYLPDNGYKNILSRSLLPRSLFPRTLADNPRTLEGDSPVVRRDAQSLASNFSVMRFPGERRGITARRDFLLVSFARASPRSHTSNCRPGMLQVHMIRSAPLSVFITCHGNAYRRSREIFPRTFRAFRELTSTLF